MKTKNLDLDLDLELEPEAKRTFQLVPIIALASAGVVVLTLVLIDIICYFVMKSEFISSLDLLWIQPLIFLGASILIATVISLSLGKYIVNPVYAMLKATDKIANGDYSVRLVPSGTKRIKELGGKFNHMAEEIGGVETLRSDFVNNFSHEFKTPIASISGFAKMLKDDSLTAKQRDEYLDIIIKESERLTELSTNVLNLSRLEKQAILCDVKKFNISEQIRLCIVMLESKWAKKDVDFAFDCDEVYINGNSDLMNEVWLNIIDNAIKFSPNGSTVTIDISVNDKSCVVKVTDEGPGMDMLTAKSAFNKFYQADNSKTNQGNGLGLAIVKKIISLHNGAVSIESDGKCGSTVVVELPLN